MAQIDEDPDATRIVSGSRRSPDPQTVDDARTRVREAPASNALAPLGPGSVIKERFVIESQIGHGGMGIVYRARDLRKEETQRSRSVRGAEGALGRVSPRSADGHRVAA